MNQNISVVITCFREGSLIYQAIESIKHQTLKPLEIIIVNDASTDGETIEVCRELEKEPTIKVLWRKKNGGPSIARNDGFEIATTDILVPLDADDILPNNALELIFNTFQSHPNAGFVYGNYLRQDRKEEEGEIVNPGDVSLTSMLRAKKFSLSTNWKLLGTTPIRRSLWKSLNGYDPTFGINDLHDVEFWIRVLASGCNYYYIDDTIYIWRKYLGSNSRHVTTTSWERIANKYFSIYENYDLSYRAYEILLLESKWSNEREKCNIYRQKLKSCIFQGKFQVSSLVILTVPTFLLKFLGRVTLKSR